MARRGDEDDTAPKLQNFQIGSSWIPSTPGKKPDSTPGHPICANWQQNQHVVQTNWLEPKLLSRVNQVTQPNWPDTGNFACYSSVNSVNASGDFTTREVGEAAASSPVYRDTLRSFDTWEANSRVHGDEFQRNDNKFSMDDPDTNWTNMSFGNLLALAHLGGNTSAENAVTKTAGFHPYGDVGSHSTISFGNPSVPELGSLLGEKFDAGLKRVPGILRDGSSTPSRPLFDLNSPPRTIRDAALSISTSSHFQPITPEKTNKAEQRRESAIIDLTTDDMPSAKDVQTSTITADEVNILYEKKEHSQLVADQLSETTLTQLSENHKPDKGGTAEADLTKTPQLKPRRRKHRPKVIIEGQTKGTPKPHLEKPSAPQESPVIKRKYVRRKAVGSQDTSPVEGEFIESDSNKNTPSKDTPAGKRKYVRKKISGKLEGITDERTIEETEPNTIRNTRSSCRRSLNFTSDSQVRDESSSYTPSSNFNILQAENVSANEPSRTPNVHCRRGPEVVMEKNDMGIAYELTKTAYQDLQDYLSSPEIHPSSCSSPINPDSLYNGYGLTDQSVCTKGKCQIVFSDVTHDKEANIAQVSESIDGRQRTPKSTNNSICSSSYYMQEKQASGFRRQIMGTRAEAELCSTNASRAFYGSMQSYLPIFSKNADKNDCTFGMHFPTIYKKKRTEKGFNAATSSSQYTATTSNSSGKLARHNHRDSFTHMSSWTNQGFFIAPCESNNLLKTNPAPDGVQIGRQVFEDLLALGSTEKIKRKRSKGPTRPRNLASLLEICEGKPVSPGKAAKTSNGREIEIHREPFTCMEALVADTCSTMKTKKRSKRSLPMNSASHNFNNRHEFSTQSIGPPLAITWKYTSPIDSVIQLLNQLDLNAEFSLVSSQKQNAFMACQMNYQEQHALVPFQRGGAVVPFDGSFEEVKRKRPRPKVELDNETARVWKLLLENINSEGIDGTDEEKAKWWEEERRVFNGRADSFIARMHLVQGDRRFSPWKGSVLDSVIGVFLTQNVSDHLSSSAFMSLAARFPIDSKTNTAELNEAREITKGKEPEICMPDSDETFGLSNNDLPTSDRPEMLQHFEDSENRGVRSIKCSSDGSIPKDDFRDQLPDVEKTGPVVPNESAANKSVSMFEEGRDMDDTVSSQASVISSQNTTDSPITQTTERTDSCSLSNSEEEPAVVGDKSIGLASSTSFVKLLEMAGSMRHGVYGEGGDKKMSDENQLLQTLQIENPWGYPAFSAKPSASCWESAAETSLEAHTECLNFSKKYIKDSASSSGKETDGTETSGLSAEFAPNATSEMSMTVNSEGLKLSSPNAHQSNNDKVDMGLNKVEKPTGQVLARSFQENTDKVQGIPGIITCHQILMDVTASSSITQNSRNSEHKEVNSSKTDPTYLPVKKVKEPKAKGTRTGKAKQNPVDWDNLRKQAQESGRKSVKTGNTMDSVDWDAVRCADVNEIAFTIKERGMNNMLAERIKDFLNRLVRDHESIDLEWLRDIPPDKAKEYLLSIRGLGLKSTECVRLLTLHHLAFPVDTNVGRIAVRLGWVPLQPLPESLQLHLLELYPVLESIQKYLWPRLCKLDQRTLYELHYQMITFGKVFCTKSKPNCNACPMRGECRHFASAFASARLALPAPEEKSIINAAENKAAGQNPIRCGNTLQLPSPQANHMCTTSGVSNSHPIVEEPASPEPIVEVPDSPEPEHTQVLECDIEDMFAEDPDEIPTIHLNIEQFTQNLQKVMQQNTELQDGDMSKALVALNPEAASIPMPKLKNMSRLRTEHLVYELPDSHPLLEGMDKREPDDPSPYLLAIWTPGETVDSIEPPETRCSSQESGKMCTEETCVSCSSLRELKSQTVRGTLLIPCRTAMRGSFPLNGTYFQVNEVFSDHESSLTPMDVPREWLWNLPRRTVYFGTSIPTIFKGLTTEGIQYCFWRGFVCVRGFDRKTRAPRPLIARLHFPASKLANKGKGKTDDN